MRKIKPLGKGSSVNKIRRALGNGSGSELHLQVQEEKHIGVSDFYPHYDFHIELRNAILEAEQKKAKGILEYQKYNRPR